MTDRTLIDAIWRLTVGAYIFFIFIGIITISIVIFQKYESESYLDIATYIFIWIAINGFGFLIIRWISRLKDSM